MTYVNGLDLVTMLWKASPGWRWEMETSADNKPHQTIIYSAVLDNVKKKKKSTKCPENITIVEGRTMDRNMEKEWTGVTYSELLFTAFIMISCFYLWFS